MESYLYAARGHRALAQSVFAEGERRGFTERRLRQAAIGLGINAAADCWELPLVRAQALDARQIRTLDQAEVAPRPIMPTLHLIGGDMRLRRRAA